MKRNRILLLVILVILVMTLFACGKSNYKITFHPNNGQKDVVWSGQGEMPTFTREGYEIEGYYSDKRFLKPISIDDITKNGLKKNVDIYIKWKVAEAKCNHKVEIDKAVPATCTADGLTEGKHCSKCKEVIVAQTKVSALGHNLSSFEAKNPTCTEIGWEAYDTCSRCDYTTKVEIPARHTPKEAEEENYVPAKCTVDGSYDLVVYCEICNHEISRESKTIGKLDHNLVDFPAVQPTCTEKGWSAGKACTRCNATLREEYPALEHDIIHHQAQAPTCTENGWGAYDTCSRCEYTTKVEIPASHNLTHHEAKASTCTEIGWDEYEACSRCDYSTYNEIPEKGHDLSFYEAKAPTCMQAGWDEYELCLRCGYTTRVIKPAIDHNYGENGKCATCSNNTYLTFELNDDRQSYKVTGIQENCTPKHLVIPSKINGKAVTTIGESAFGVNWDDLSAKGLDVETLTIPATVTTIEAGAFFVKESFGIEAFECVRFDEIYYLGTLEQWCNMSIFGQNVYNSVINSSSINCAMPVISADVMYIDGKPLSGELVIPTSVTSINSWVFYGAKDITNVVLHPGVAYIGEGAFAACSSLTNINIPEGITAIEQFTFYGCKALPSIALPEGIVSIGFEAFCSAVAIETIYVPESLTLVETDAFAGSNVNDVYFAGTKEQFDSIVVEKGNDTVFGAGWLPQFGSTKHFAKYTQKENVIEATCLTGGSHDLVLYYTRGNVKISSTHVTVPALGHDITHYDAKEPTCTEIGWGAYDTCSRCEYTTKVEIPATGHSHSSVAVTPPTCTEQGYTTHTCICGDSYVDTYVDANGHTLGNWYETKAPAITEAGEERRDCNDCDYYETNELPALGYGGTWGNLTWTLNETTGHLTISGTGEMDDFEYDSTSAWREYKNLIKSVTIEDGVTTIGDYAFYNCHSLASIVVGNRVTTIGYAAFYGCSNLKKITIPNSVTAIEEYAFFDCSALQTIILSKQDSQLMSIGTVAFENCTSLTNFIIPEKVTDLGYGAFAYCSSLQTITIPVSVTTIKEKTFYGCGMLNTVKYGGTQAQWSKVSIGINNDPLKAATVYYGQSVVQSGTWGSLDWTLNESTGELVISGIGEMDAIDSTEEAWLKHKTLIKTVTIEDGVTSIGEGAFVDCTNLTNAVISSTVTSIGEGVFNGCSALESITVPFVGNRAGVTNSDKNQYPFGYIFGTDSYEGGVSVDQIYMGNGDVTSDRYYLPKTLKYVTVLGGYIPYGAFNYCKDLINVTMCEGVTAIGDRAFYGCTDLYSLVFPSTLTSIGKDGVFSESKHITIVYNYSSLTINTGYQDITYTLAAEDILTVTEDKIVLLSQNGKTIMTEYRGEEATVVIPEGVTQIGRYAFFTRPTATGVGDPTVNLRTIIIPTSVTNIATSAFYYCEKLTSVKYLGTEEQWNSIVVGQSNDPLKSATITYNYVA